LQIFEEDEDIAPENLEENSEMNELFDEMRPQDEM
jgi:hypothetical protein